MSTFRPYETADAAPRIELDQGWEFLPDPSGRLLYIDINSRSEWRAARVGLSWNVQFEDLRDYMGAAWYRTIIDCRTSLTPGMSCSSSAPSITSANCM